MAGLTGAVVLAVAGFAAVAVAGFGAALALVPATLISAEILLKMPSPMPFTFLMSAVVLKLPFCLRYSTMAFALLGPMPDKVCNSASVAVLMLMAAQTDEVNSSANKAMNRCLIVMLLQLK